MVDYPINIFSIIVPVSTTCLAGHYYSMQGPVLGKTTYVFSLTSACIKVSKSMKASQHIKYI